MIGYFFLFGFVKIGLVFQSLSDLILLIRSQYHPIRHHKHATCISQAASNANHYPRKADQCAIKARRERMHQQLSTSTDTDTDSNVGWGNGRVARYRQSTNSLSKSSIVIPIFVIQIFLIRRFNPFP